MKRFTFLLKLTSLLALVSFKPVFADFQIKCENIRLDDEYIGEITLVAKSLALLEQSFSMDSEFLTNPIYRVQSIEKFKREYKEFLHKFGDKAREEFLKQRRELQTALRSRYVKTSPVDLRIKEIENQTRSASQIPIFEIQYVNWVSATVITSDGTKLITAASNEKKIHVIDLITGSLIQEIPIDGNVKSLALSLDGQELLITKNGPVFSEYVIYDLNNHKVNKTKGFAANFLIGSAKSFDKKYFAMAYNDRVQVNSVLEDKQLYNVVHDGAVTSVAITQDGKYLLTGGTDKLIKVSELNTGQLIREIQIDGKISGISLSRDGLFVAVGVYTENDSGILSDCHNGAKVIEIATGKTVYSFLHDSWVTSVLLSTDGKYLLTGTDDGSVTVFDLVQSKEIHLLTHGGRITSISMSADRKYIVTGSQDNLVRIFYNFSPTVK
jgi:WD40 repeat protein